MDAPRRRLRRLHVTVSSCGLERLENFLQRGVAVASIGELRLPWNSLTALPPEIKRLCALPAPPIRPPARRSQYLEYRISSSTG